MCNVACDNFIMFKTIRVYLYVTNSSVFFHIFRIDFININVKVVIRLLLRYPTRAPLTLYPVYTTRRYMAYSNFNFSLNILIIITGD